MSDVAGHAKQNPYYAKSESSEPPAQAQSAKPETWWQKQWRLQKEHEKRLRQRRKKFLGF
jgi:hypothetical protein